MLRLTTLCSTNITAVWIECKAGIKKTQPQKTNPKTKYIQGKVHINSDQTILFNNFFSRNNFTNTKKGLLFMVCLGI